MFENVDWSHGAEHMFEKHGVTVEQANEALHDPMRLVLFPYKSQSGKSGWVIGFSQSFDDVLSIVVVKDDDDVEYGATGFRAENPERRDYLEGAE